MDYHEWRGLGIYGCMLGVNFFSAREKTLDTKMFNRHTT